MSRRRAHEDIAHAAFLPEPNRVPALLPYQTLMS